MDPPDLALPPYARYLRERHGCRVFRVAVDAGFGCPNRAGGRSGAGCTYCAADGGRAPYLGAPSCAIDLERQVKDGVDFLRRRYDAEAFILFFQAYSNTNAPVDALKRIYDHGLALAAFRGLNVATRPDCLDGAEGRPARVVRAPADSRSGASWASSRQMTRRCAGSDAGTPWGISSARMPLLKERGMKHAVHLIFGLPGEGLAEIMQTIDEIARLRVDGVKIHNLHVPEGTALAQEFMAGRDHCAVGPVAPGVRGQGLERLPQETVIMRLQCDTPRKALLAPRGFDAKQGFSASVAAAMRERGLRQGCAQPFSV